MQFSSIKRSLLMIVLLVTSCALLLAFSINILSQVERYEQSIIQRAQAYAKITSFNAVSSVVFDDTSTEEQRLKSLSNSPFIEHVHIYRVDDVTSDLSFFASYNKQGLAPIPAKFAQIEQLTQANIEDNYVEVAEPITLDDNVIGYVYLRGSMDEVSSFWQNALLVAMLVFVLTVTLSVLATLQLRRSITKPLDKMVGVIQQVARDKDYSLRLPASALLELNSMSQAFNTMLDRVQQHIARQRKAEQEASTLNTELEQQVTQRTQALKEANRELLKTLEQLHQYQSHLVESEKMASLGDMVAGIAHEVNTPIGLSVTASTLLQDKLKVMQEKFDERKISTQEFERFLNDCDDNLAIIYRNLNRAAELITSFKQVAVDQSTEVDREINLCQFMDDVLLSLRPRLKPAENFPIEIECADDLVIETKPGPLNQIMMNLILNSMVHGFDGRQQGKIHVSFAINNGELELVYQDDGRGVPVNIRRRIFDPFVTTKRGSGGSGLGMHLVYNLVTQVLGGHIHLFSEEEHGVEFIIRFPVTVVEHTSEAS